MCRINLSSYIGVYGALGDIYFYRLSRQRYTPIGRGLREYFLISGHGSGGGTLLLCNNRGLCPGPIFTGCPPLFRIIIPQVIFRKTHRLAKRILPNRFYFHLNYVHE